MFSTSYKHVAIKINFLQLPDGSWTGTGELTWPNGDTQTLHLNDSSHSSRELAKENAVEDAQRIIEHKLATHF